MPAHRRTLVLVRAVGAVRTGHPEARVAPAFRRHLGERGLERRPRWGTLSAAGKACLHTGKGLICFGKSRSSQQCGVSPQSHMEIRPAVAFSHRKAECDLSLRNCCRWNQYELKQKYSTHHLLNKPEHWICNDRKF